MRGMRSRTAKDGTPSALTLFDELERTDDSYRRRTESAFAYLNRSPRPDCGVKRVTLERWFTEYPGDSKKELRARFRDDDQNHESAFFELLVYEVLRRLSLALRVDPKPRTGRGRPDFEATDTRGDAYYVEATVAGQSILPDHGPLEAQVLDAIDDLAREEPIPIALEPEFTGKLKRAPSLGRIKRELSMWLRGLDLSDSSQVGSYAGLSHTVRCDDSCSLTLTVVDAPQFPATALVRQGVYTVAPPDADDMMGKIRDKASQFGTLDRPLLVAVSPRGLTDCEDEMDALFGRLGFRLHEDSAGNVIAQIPERERDSVWIRRTGSQYSRLHGVLFFRRATLWNLTQASARLYVNPYIEAEVPDELRRLGSARVQDGVIRFEPGEQVRDVLELPNGWNA